MLMVWHNGNRATEKFRLPLPTPQRVAFAVRNTTDWLNWRPSLQEGPTSAHQLFRQACDLKLRVETNVSGVVLLDENIQEGHDKGPAYHG